MNDIREIIIIIEDFLKNSKGQKASWRVIKKYLNTKIEGDIDPFLESNIQREIVTPPTNITVRGKGGDAELQLKDEGSGRMAKNTNDFSRVKTGQSPIRMSRKKRR